MVQNQTTPRLSYGKRAFIAFDQLAEVLLFNGEPDETVSARSYRLRAVPFWGWMQRTLDRIFYWQPEHCRQSYEWEQARGDLPPEYQSAGAIEA